MIKRLLKRIAKTFRKIFPPRTLTIVLAYTTDVHGALLAYDYLHGRPTRWGLSKVATRIAQLRRQHRHVLFLDNGDVLQGSPLTSYYNFVRKRGLHPVAKAMNALGYEVSCVGNHDVEQGPAIYRRIRRQFAFPWLSANAITRQKKSFFQPYTIREIEGIRIAILGLTTPAIPLWLNHDLYPGIYWQDMKEAAHGWLRFLKQKKKADVVVGLFHAGLHPSSGQPGWPAEIPEENPCLQIARELPELDVILTGHEHRLYNSQQARDPAVRALKPVVLMAGSHARHLGVVRLSFGRTKNSWTLLEKKAHIESLRDVPEDPAFRTMLEPYHHRVLAYVNSKIGTAEADISSRYSRFQDGPFLDLIHRAQLHVTRARVSLAASFTTSFVLRKGPVRVRDVYALYPFENYLYVVIMSGAQLKAHLEWCARYFNTVPARGPAPEHLINTDFMGFNFDTARGVRYEIDISRPVGERIFGLRWEKNDKPVHPAQTFKVAVNSYRAQQLRLRFGCRVLWKSNKEMRDLLIEFIRAMDRLPLPFQPGWRIVPEAALEALLRSRPQ